MTKGFFERSYKVGDVVFLRDSSTEIGVSSKLRHPWTGPFLVIGARAPIYRLRGRKRSMVVHHDRLKPCEDSTFPLWLQRQRNKFLETLPIEEVEDSNLEPDLDEPSPDDPPDISVLFDPEQTLPYMLGDDPELLEDDNQFDLPLPFASQVPTDIASQASDDLDPHLDPGDQFETFLRPAPYLAFRSKNTYTGLFQRLSFLLLLFFRHFFTHWQWHV